MKLVFILAVVSFWFPAQAEDEKSPTGKYVGYDFHWDGSKKKGVCVNKAKKKGLNPHYVGPCGDLRGLDLSDYDLSGKDLSGSFLDGINFESANFNGTKLTWVKARGTDFSKAKMNGADLSWGILSGSKFDGAQLNGAKFYNSNLSGAKIKDAELSGTRFQKSNIRGAHLQSNMKTVVVKGAAYTIGTRFDESVTSEHKKMMTNASTSAVATIESDDDDLSMDEDRTPASSSK